MSKLFRVFGRKNSNSDPPCSDQLESSPQPNANLPTQCNQPVSTHTYMPIIESYSNNYDFDDISTSLFEGMNLSGITSNNDELFQTDNKNDTLTVQKDQIIQDQDKNLSNTEVDQNIDIYNTELKYDTNTTPHLDISNQINSNSIILNVATTECTSKVEALLITDNSGVKKKKRRAIQPGRERGELSANTTTVPRSSSSLSNSSEADNMSNTSRTPDPNNIATSYYNNNSRIDGASSDAVTAHSTHYEESTTLDNTANTSRESLDNSKQTTQIDELLATMDTLSDIRKEGEQAVASRVLILQSRCTSQRRLHELRQLIEKAESRDDLEEAGWLNEEQTNINRELMESQIICILDVWKEFYSDVIDKYNNQIGDLQSLANVSQEAIKKLERESTRIEQENSRKLEEHQHELSLLREKHDHSSKQIWLERDHILNRQTLLEDELSQRTRHLIQDKISHQEKKTEISQEISELEIRLSELRSEFNKIDSCLSEVETNLDRAHSSVSEERLQLSQEMGNIQKQEDVLHERKVTISNKVLEIEEMEKESLDSSSSYKNKLELLKAAPDMLLSLEHITNNNNNNNNNAGYPAELESALFSHFEEGIKSELFVSVNKLEETIDRIVSEMDDCKESLKNLEWRLKIENEKLRDLDEKRRKFTQVKKYREAQQATSDRKQTMETLENIKMEIEAATHLSSTLNNDFGEKCELLDQAKVNWNQEMIRNDIYIWKCLQEIISTINKSSESRVGISFDLSNDLLQYKRRLYEVYLGELAIKHQWSSGILDEKIIVAPNLTDNTIQHSPMNSNQNGNYDYSDDNLNT